MLYSTLDNFFHQFSAMYYWHLKVKFSITFPFHLPLYSYMTKTEMNHYKMDIKPCFLASSQRLTAFYAPSGPASTKLKQRYSIVHIVQKTLQFCGPWEIRN